MQQGGSQPYGAPPPEIGPFSPSAGGGASRGLVLGVPGPEHHQPAAEAASPISSRPPAAVSVRGLNFDEFGGSAGGAAPAGPGYPDEEALAAGEEAERGATGGGNRWPRQETLALLKIRSDMDAAFRDATLKGPLWEDVSRKLAEMGYTRSAKKCKEKFENVHKYYKRTKDKSAGRPDGKSYRFFSQLEALHGSATGGTAPTTPAAASAATSAVPPYQSSTPAFLTGGIAPPIQPTPISSIAPPEAPRPIGGAGASAAEGEEFIFSSSASSSDSDTECDETEDGLDMEGQRKRKRQSDDGAGGGGGRRKMMAFFKDLMNQVMDKQEMMQQRFLEAIEKREQDRMVREEAWRRQEMARLSREHDMAAQERAISASRDAAIVSFLQKVTGQTVPLPPQPITITVVQPPPSQPAPPPMHNVTAAPPTPQPVAAAPPPPQAAPPQRTPPPQAPPPQPTQRHRNNSQKTAETAQTPPQLASPAAAATQEQTQEPGTGGGGGGGIDPASSRWPKSEVHALIKIRSEFEPRYQEAGPKGPLWEEISAAMKRQGYSRSSKRCKEKWENINKYFKKVKESNKKRPEDAKTCPYFHQLDALYRSKILGGSGNGGSTSQSKLEHEPNPNPNGGSPAAAPPPPPPNFTAQQPQAAEKESSKNGDGTKSSNGDLQPPNRKPAEDIVKGAVDKGYGDQDSENMEDDEDDDEDDEMPYRIEFQRPNGNGKSNGGGSTNSAAAASSFLAMVQQNM